MTALCSQTTLSDVQGCIVSDAEVLEYRNCLRSTVGPKCETPVLDVLDSYEQKFYDVLMTATLQAIIDREAVPNTKRLQFTTKKDS